MDPKMQEMFETGAGILLPETDVQGRRIILLRVQHIDAARYNSSDIFRYAVALLDTILTEDWPQINGFVLVVDALNTGFGQISLFSITEVIKITRTFLHALPIQLECVYVANLPWIATQLAHFFKFLLGNHIKDGFKFFQTMEDMCNEFDVNLLPKEYGGTIPVSDLIQETKRKLGQHAINNLGKYDNFITTNFKHSSYWTIQ
jgi:hypothetical protein